MDITEPGAQGQSHTADIKCGNHLLATLLKAPASVIEKRSPSTGLNLQTPQCWKQMEDHGGNGQYGRKRIKEK